LEYFHSPGDRGENQWIAFKAYPAEDGGISVYFRDITERKKADEELIRLATAIEQSAEAVFITDPKWIIRYVNPAFEHLSGYRKNEIIGKHTSLLKSDAHDAAFYRRIRETLQAGKVWSGRITSRKKDGSVFESEATDSPVRDATGNIINYVGVSRDITVEMRLEKELRQAQKMEAIGTLAGGIAHDFNNILSIIIGFTEMAKVKLPESDPISENLQRVLDAGGRATDLVKQILTFSRWKEQEKRPVQIASFVKEALKLMRPLIPSTIEIRREILVAPEQTIVLMDPTEIHQVLMNLCTNASHAMREKGGILSVRVKELEADHVLVSRHLDLEIGSYICLSVSDTGIGMDAAIMERIFDPYFTTKELGVGTGLGLPVVQGIVKGHNGAISVYSEPGNGTTFNVYLPRIEGGGFTSATKREVFPPGSERILFLDDEKQMAELGEEMLAPFGYKVTAMTDSKEALEMFRANTGAFDLIITDMTMPVVTGKQFALEVKALRPELPIILCTGFSELINEIKARESGIDAFLMKPYSTGDLMRTIRRVLGE
jgi:PAS domain S-box-containing protein